MIDGSDVEKGGQSIRKKTTETASEAQQGKLRISRAQLKVARNSAPFEHFRVWNSGGVA